MPDAPQRVIGASGPALRVERQQRYALVSDLIRESALWCDLGCGTGVEASAALGGRSAGRALLVDGAHESLEEARRQFPADEVMTLEADLGSDDGVATVAAALTEQQPADGAVTITCFDCIERLQSFAPLVSKLVELAERHSFTVVLSAPNDAFWSNERPEVRTSWGEGSFEELRTLLPPQHVLLRQLLLQGSAITRADGDPELRPVEVELDPAGVPSHMLAAFGPARERLAPSAAVTQVDMEEQRRWERQRDADLAFAESGRSAERAPEPQQPERSKQTA